MNKRRNFTRAVAVEIVKRSCARREDGQPSCERCGAIGCKLEVHHLAMDAMQVEKSRKLTADDGELLCEPCHDPITSKQRKELAKAQAREAKHAGVARSTQKIANRGFALSERTIARQAQELKAIPPRRMMFVDEK